MWLVKLPDIPSLAAENCLNPHTPVKPVKCGCIWIWGSINLSPQFIGEPWFCHHAWIPRLQAGTQRSTDHHRPHGVLKDHAIGRWQDPHRRCDRQGHGQCLGDHGDFSCKKDGDFHVQQVYPIPIFFQTVRPVGCCIFQFNVLKTSKQPIHPSRVSTWATQERQSPTGVGS